jgi:hypothetical protein
MAGDGKPKLTPEELAAKIARALLKVEVPPKKPRKKRKTA